MRRFFCLLIVFVFTQKLFAQISISGPQCVTTGTVYQYIIHISGKFDSLSKLQLCITGGKFEDSKNNCIPAADIRIKVTWNPDAVNGNIAITSLRDNASLSVVITPPLNGGLISSNYKSQLTSKDSLPPSSIICSAASGGACTPVYSYQWQQSDNGVDWKDIRNATGQNLGLNQKIPNAYFYRRKVTETSSGSIQYSDFAAIYINRQTD